MAKGWAIRRPGKGLVMMTFSDSQPIGPGVGIGVQVLVSDGVIVSVAVGVGVLVSVGEGVKV